MVDNACAEVNQWITFYYACSNVTARGWRQAYHIISHAKSCTVPQRFHSQTGNFQFDPGIMSSMSRIARVGSRILSAASGRSGSAATGEKI